MEPNQGLSVGAFLDALGTMGRPRGAGVDVYLPAMAAAGSLVRGPEREAVRRTSRSSDTEPSAASILATRD